MRATDGGEDLSPYLEHLRQLPFVRGARVARRAPLIGERRWDAQILVKTPTGAVSFVCEMKRASLTRELGERIARSAREVDHLLVFASSVSRETSELFRREGVNFIDLAGNCFVRVDDRYLAWIQGLRVVERAVVDRALRAAAYRALFVLLADASLLEAPVRVVAAKAGGVSPQTVADLRVRLVEQGVILRAGARSRWAPTGWRHALDLWLAGFSATLSPRLVVGRFRPREREVGPLEERLASSLDAGTWRWGGGAAAQRLTGYYRGDRTVVYLAEVDVSLPKRLALVRDAAGPLVLVRSPGPLAFESPRGDTVHPLLVYADLLAEGHDRAQDAAHVVFEKYLQGLESTS